MYNKLQQELDNLNENSLLRELKSVEQKGKYIFVDGQKHLNLNSNDYLGIASNEQISKEFLSKYEGSLGSASSRLLTGNNTAFTKLEDLLAQKFHKESALIFNSGYHANIGILSALNNKGCAVFSDKLNHASIIDGMRLSKGEFFRYKHLDYEHLETLLEQKRNNFETTIIVSESVFSMDGDVCDTAKLVELKKKYNCILIIDEAHGFGVFGENGLGVCESQNTINDIDLIVGVFGKSVGSIGAFCIGNKILIDYLINTARSFIFSTALAPINIAFSHFVIKNIFPTLNTERKNLIQLANNFRQNLQNLGLNTFGASQVIPLIVGENDKTSTLCQHLQENGFYLLPIRHPTVAKGTARLRISLRADLKYNDIEQLPTMTGQMLLG